MTIFVTTTSCVPTPTDSTSSEAVGAGEKTRSLVVIDRGAVVVLKFIASLWNAISIPFAGPPVHVEPNHGP